MSNRAGLFGRGALSAIALSLSIAIITPAHAIECVPYARQISGVEIRGDAWTWWGQARPAGYETGGRPQAGAVMVFKRANGMRRGHVAVVREIVGPREVIIDHANWQLRRSRYKGRIDRGVSVIDVSPRNDWSSVRVWFPPIDDYGSSVYPLYGFIYGDRDDRAIEVAAVAAGGRVHTRRVDGKLTAEPVAPVAVAAASVSASGASGATGGAGNATLPVSARANPPAGTLDNQLIQARQGAGSLQVRGGRPVVVGRPVYSPGDPLPSGLAPEPQRRPTERADEPRLPTSRAAAEEVAEADVSPVRYVALKPQAAAGGQTADSRPPVLPSLKPLP